MMETKLGSEKPLDKDQDALIPTNVNSFRM